MFILSLRSLVVKISDSSLTIKTPIKIKIKNISRYKSSVIIKIIRIQIDKTIVIFSDINNF